MQYEYKWQRRQIVFKPMVPHLGRLYLQPDGSHLNSTDMVWLGPAGINWAFFEVLSKQPALTFLEPRAARKGAAKPDILWSMPKARYPIRHHCRTMDFDRVLGIAGIQVLKTKPHTPGVPIISTHFHKVPRPLSVSLGLIELYTADKKGQMRAPLPPSPPLSSPASPRTATSTRIHEKKRLANFQCQVWLLCTIDLLPPPALPPPPSPVPKHHLCLVN